MKTRRKSESSTAVYGDAFGLCIVDGDSLELVSSLFDFSVFLKTVYRLKATYIAVVKN